MTQTPLRIGLVGCGEVCEHKHMPALRQLADATVTAVADTDPDRARHVADRYGIPHRFSTARELIDSGETDVVGVLTPPGQHLEPAITAMGAGCHVLVEKPIALTLDDADALVRAAEGHGGKVLMGFHMRWHRLVQRVRERIRNTPTGGTAGVGRIESIRSVWNSPRGDDGTPDWKLTRASGGGSIVELGVHLFDLWSHLLDTDVEEVFARTRHGIRQDENATISAVLKSGALATAELSERSGHDMGVEICGSEGRMRMSGVRFDGFEVYGRRETPGMVRPRLRQLRRFAQDLPQGLASMRRLGDYGDSYVGEWRHLLEAIRKDAPVDCTLREGRRALQVALAAAASASSGESIRLADAPRSLTPVNSAGR